MKPCHCYYTGLYKITLYYSMLQVYIENLIYKEFSLSFTLTRFLISFLHIFLLFFININVLDLVEALVVSFFFKGLTYNIVGFLKDSSSCVELIYAI